MEARPGNQQGALNFTAVPILSAFTSGYIYALPAPRPRRLPTLPCLAFACLQLRHVIQGCCWGRASWRWSRTSRTASGATSGARTTTPAWAPSRRTPAPRPLSAPPTPSPQSFTRPRPHRNRSRAHTLAVPRSPMRDARCGCTRRTCRGGGDLEEGLLRTSPLVSLSLSLGQSARG